jgi:hypothetical protein
VIDAFIASVPLTSGMVGTSWRSSAISIPPMLIVRSATPLVGSTPLASMKPVDAVPVRCTRRLRISIPASVRASRASGTASVQCVSRRRRSMSRSSTPFTASPSSSRMPEARRSVFSSLRRSMPNEADSGARLASSATERMVWFPRASPWPFTLTFPVHTVAPRASRPSAASWSAWYVCQRSPLPRALKAISG